MTWRRPPSRRVLPPPPARVNVEVNLAGITDEQASLEMIAETGKADDIIARAEQITASVRDEIRG